MTHTSHNTSGNIASWNFDRLANHAWWRRLTMFLLVAGTTAGGTALMAITLEPRGFELTEIAFLAVFTLGFGWIALSFWAAIIGFVLQVLGLHPLTLHRHSAWMEDPLPDLQTRTAIVMPIYNEEPQATFQRIVQTYLSLEATGRLASFDFHMLSDTTDDAIAQREVQVWMKVRQQLGAESRLFYRRRAKNIGRKAGNIADWLAGQGVGYDHMVVLDADSTMSGDTLVRLAALMEANPRTGIIQTLAVAAGRETLFARVLQFSSRLYGPLLAAGHSFWQMGEANYYGHNAIIRTAAFAVHCDLPLLPGAAPLGGEILSHDFVEAAFIRRGGYHVWMLPELGGSFEEMPSNLLDYAARDRRWVQGNLQHGRLLGSPGLHGMSRLHFAMGILGYVASPLWLASLLLSGAIAIEQEAAGHVYFGATRSLFPLWPEYRTEEVHALLALTGLLLLLPKILALLVTLASTASARRFGGHLALISSATAELAVSMLLAPVMMLLHTSFILRILAGRAVGWPPQPREDRGVAWSAALQRHALHALAGGLAATAMAMFAPAYLPWIAPVVAGLVLSVPLAVLSSQRSIGVGARRIDLFVTQQEIAEPAPRHAVEQLAGSD